MKDEDALYRRNKPDSAFQRVDKKALLKGVSKRRYVTNYAHTPCS